MKIQLNYHETKLKINIIPIYFVSCANKKAKKIQS